MKECGSMICRMAREEKHGKTHQLTKASTNKDRSMVKAYMYGRMEAFIVVPGSIIKFTDTAPISGLMEGCMSVCGKTTKCTERVT